MTDMMRRPRGSISGSRPASPESGFLPWAPEGDMEVYVHSRLSEPYGERDSEGLEGVLSPENIRIARKCRQIDRAVDRSSPESVKEGLREIGRILVGTMTILSPGADIDTTGLIEVQPLREATDSR